MIAQYCENNVAHFFKYFGENVLLFALNISCIMSRIEKSCKKAGGRYSAMSC